MAKVMLLHETIFAQKFAEQRRTIIDCIDAILHASDGKQPYSPTTDMHGIHERIYEIPEQGTVVVKLATEMQRYSLSGMTLFINGEEHHCSGYILFSGFTKTPAYARLKKDIDDCVKKILNENY